MNNRYCSLTMLLGLFFALLLITSCGGGGASRIGTSTPTGGLATIPPVVTRVYSSVSATICSNDGIQVDAGRDDNGNGTLDPTEVDNTQYVCNGAAGSVGISTLIGIFSETAGANCSSGGKKVSVGKDTNKNNVLDAFEIASSKYICNAVNFDSGASSSVDYALLGSVVLEPSSTNCPAGGVKVSSGLDANANGQLDPAEMTASDYICNVIYVDTIKPAAPANLTAVASPPNHIDLAWDPALDNNWVLGYKIYRDGQYRMFTGLLSVSDTGLTSAQQYCYNISAVDMSGNESGLSLQVCATTL